MMLGIYQFIPTEKLISYIQLPAPHFKSAISVEEAILRRESRRDYKNSPISLEALSQLLWSAQGIRNSAGFRVAPSAGAKYPLELFVIVRHVSNLKPGVYHYQPQFNRLELVQMHYDKSLFNKAALKQTWVRDAPVVIIIASNTKRTAEKYHQYAFRYVLMESGHVAENMMLQAVSLKLGIVGVGGFDDKAVQEIFHLKGLHVLYLICIGNKQG